MLTKIGEVQAPQVQESQIVEAQTETATTPQPESQQTQPVNVESQPGQSNHEKWFMVHKNEWPAIRDQWKAEGLTSKQRDEKLKKIVAEWAQNQSVSIDSETQNEFAAGRSLQASQS